MPIPNETRFMKISLVQKQPNLSSPVHSTSNIVQYEDELSNYRTINLISLSPEGQMESTVRDYRLEHKGEFDPPYEV